MVLMGRGNATRASAAIAAAIAVALSLSPLSARAADDKPIVMKIALATLDDVLHQYAKNYAAAVEKDSAGRIKVEIYPASQLGSIQRQAEGVQFGAIQCQIVAPEFLVGIDERFEVLGGARPGDLDGAGPAPCRRSGGAPADARRSAPTKGCTARRC